MLIGQQNTRQVDAIINDLDIATQEVSKHSHKAKMSACFQQFAQVLLNGLLVHDPGERMNSELKNKDKLPIKTSYENAHEKLPCSY